MLSKCDAGLQELRNAFVTDVFDDEVPILDDDGNIVGSVPLPPSAENAPASGSPEEAELFAQLGKAAGVSDEVAAVAEIMRVRQRSCVFSNQFYQ